jgi:hypothetical protein
LFAFIFNAEPDITPPEKFTLEPVISPLSSKMKFDDDIIPLPLILNVTFSTNEPDSEPTDTLELGPALNVNNCSYSAA